MLLNMGFLLQSALICVNGQPVFPPNGPALNLGLKWCCRTVQSQLLGVVGSRDERLAHQTRWEVTFKWVLRVTQKRPASQERKGMASGTQSR
eukprot:33712-Amphidinium_carterae.1